MKRKPRTTVLPRPYSQGQGLHPCLHAEVRSGTQAWLPVVRGKFAGLLLTGFLILFTGMIGGGGGRGELRPEIRLKLYNEAIRHYEKAEALHVEGRREDALREIRKATKVVRAFPEAYDLAAKIYGELGNEKEARANEDLFKLYEGDKGASLYRLRDRVIEEIAFRKKAAPPPDIQVLPAFLLSALLIGIALFGMIYEVRRLTGQSRKPSEEKRLFVESFPDEEEREAAPSLFFKGCVLFLPAPFLFLLLVLVGLRHYSDLLPVFLFSFLIVDLAIYLIFFADLSGLGGFRSGRPGMGG